MTPSKKWLWLVFLIGFLEISPAIRGSETPPKARYLSVTRVVDKQADSTYSEWLFIVTSGSPYDSPSVFKLSDVDYLSEIYRGTTLHWAPSCRGESRYVDIPKLKAACEKNGITLVIHPAG